MLFLLKSYLNFYFWIKKGVFLIKCGLLFLKYKIHIKWIDLKYWISTKGCRERIFTNNDIQTGIQTLMEENPKSYDLRQKYREMEDEAIIKLFEHYTRFVDIKEGDQWGAIRYYLILEQMRERNLFGKVKML